MAPLDKQPLQEDPTVESATPSTDPIASLKPALNRVVETVSTARGLPSGFYTDPDLFAIEQRRLFAEGWAGVGFAHEVPEAGDAKPFTFHGAPLLMLRDRNGDLRVYENVCRHRGMILVDEPRKIEGAIRCPYHSWCYGLDGRLVSTPHVGGPGKNIHDDIKRDELGLLEVPSDVFLGVVFVNLSKTAKPFREANAALIERWAEFDRPLFHGGAESSFTLDLAGNWKLCVENYCESYHLPWVHPGLNSYSRLEDHYNVEEYGAYSGQGTVVYDPNLADGDLKFPDFDGLDAKWDTGAEYITLFPNVMLGVHRDHTFAILLDPQSVDRTIERIEIFYTDAQAAEPAFKSLREKHAAQWKEVFVEDVFVVEGMQRGRKSPSFDGGKFSPAMDGPTHVFHDWAARQLMRDEAAT